jgi:hypothetical protein
MDMKIILLTSIVAVALLEGCATKTVATAPVEQEPILVGKPIVQRFNESSATIGNQLTLLKKLQKGEKVEPVTIITHNNNLDARIGSDKTLPKGYGIPPAPTPVTPKAPEPPKMQTIIKKIDWDNNSLNKLVTQFGTSLGYKVEVKGSNIKDVNITYHAENVTIPEGLKLLINQTTNIATIVPNDKDKILTITYK